MKYDAVLDRVDADWDVSADDLTDLPGELDQVEQQEAAAPKDEAERVDASRDVATDDRPWIPDVLVPADSESEIEHLSLLSEVEYVRARKQAAQRLGLGVGALDKAVYAVRAKRHRAAQAADRSRPQPGHGEIRWPLGVLTSPDGLYYDAGSEAGPVWICAPLEVLGEGRDTAGDGWGLLLRWRDADGKVHTWPMPRKLLVAQSGELEAELMDRGLRLAVDPTTRTHLRFALNGVRSGDRIAFAETPGWGAPGASENAYVLIDGDVIGPTTEGIVLRAPPEGAKAKMATAGTLDGWKADVASKAEGNPVAAFAVCAAFAGPLLRPLGEGSGGVHIHGRSKVGKTLAMRMGTSVWGQTRKSGLLRDWRSTANALESAAEECNDGVLMLDEIHQADPKEVVGAIYQLANESGKQRLNRDANAKRRRTWCTMVLSSGEIDIATMAAKHSSSPLPAGAEVRLPSIPIDGQDMWPNLYGSANTQELMARLQKALLKQHGTAIRPYLENLATLLAQNDGTLEQEIDALRETFYTFLPGDADPQVKEVARRCALIALAGELAIQWNILPWQRGASIAASRTVLDLWVNRRGGVGSTEESQHVKAIRSYLSEFGASRFVALDYQEEYNQPGKWVVRNPDRPIVSRTGWKRASRDRDGAEQYLIDRDGWQKMCAASGADPTEVAKTLRLAGYLAPGDGNNLTRYARLPEIGRTRVYVVNSSIFAGKDTSDDTKAA